MSPEISLIKKKNNILETDQFSDKLSSLLQASMSVSSKKAIRADLCIFFKWLDNNEYSTTLPISPQIIAEFIADFTGLRTVSTIMRYISSIAKIHRLSKMDDPTKTELVRATMCGLKKTKGLSLKKAAALSGEDLLRILDGLSDREWLSRRNRAIFTIGWSCALRSQEICDLHLRDIDETDDGIIVTIRKSKTDQMAIGDRIGIPSSYFTDLILDWKNAVTKLYGTSKGPLFCRIGYSRTDRYFPKISPRPSLSTRSLSKIIKNTLKSFGFEGSTHSLRRGFITDAARIGVPERVIQRHSRHRSVSTVRGYVEEGNIMIDNPLPAIFDRLLSSRQNS